MAHIPWDFWSIVMEYAHGGVRCTFKWQRGRLFDEHVARVMHSMCVDAKLATVTKVCIFGLL